VLLNITGGSSLGLFEVNEAAEIVAEAADPEAHIIFGAVIDDSLQDEVRVTVIATGFEHDATERIQMLNEISHKNFSSGDIDIPAFLRRKR